MDSPHSTRLRLALGWVPIRHLRHTASRRRDRWLGRCRSRGAVTHCRDDESAGTTKAGRRAWRQIRVCSQTHHAPIRRASPAPSQPFQFYSRRCTCRKSRSEVGAFFGRSRGRTLGFFFSGGVLSLDVIYFHLSKSGDETPTRSFLLRGASRAHALLLIRFGYSTEAHARRVLASRHSHPKIFSYVCLHGRCYIVRRA